MIGQSNYSGFGFTTLKLSALAAYSTFYFWLIRSLEDPMYTSSIFVHGPLHSHSRYFRLWTVDLGRSVMLRLFFSHGLAMFSTADSLAIVVKFAQQWHDILKCFVHCVWHKLCTWTDIRS